MRAAMPHADAATGKMCWKKCLQDGTIPQIPEGTLHPTPAAKIEVPAPRPCSLFGAIQILGRSRASDFATGRYVTPAEVAQKALQTIDGILDELKIQGPALMQSNPGQTGNLIRSIAAFHEAAIETHKQVVQQPSSAKEEHRAPGHDPLTEA